ncbi:MAG: SdpI family protein [Candidatus Woesearchaeota archaeon]
MKKTIAISLIIIAVSFAVAFCFYSKMPGLMASHWNSKGEVDGYMPQFWGLFLMPLVSLGMFLLFVFIPRIDPLKKNIRKFIGYYHGFIVVMLSFLLYIYLLTIFWNLGFSFNMTRLLLPALAVLFYYVGVMVSHAKRNWFIGIRTPWTLSSDRVWEKTHRVGGRLFKYSSAIIFLGLFFDQYAILFILVPVLGTALYTVVYSYFEFKKLG